jgi:class 3 adenylate cyclase
VTLRARVDRFKCIGAGNCITIAPTAFDWLPGEFGKAEVIGVETVEEDFLREAALACPTAAIELESLEELLPWQLRGKAGPSRRVVKTFMFTDIVGSTKLIEAMGDRKWENLLRWHDQTLRGLFVAHHGEEVVATGDGFFVGFDSPEAALACAVLAEHERESGFVPDVRIGLHASDATQVGDNFQGKGVHAAARIAALAGGGEILASAETAAGTRYSVSEPRTVELKGIAEPVAVVSIAWS